MGQQITAMTFVCFPRKCVTFTCSYILKIWWRLSRTFVVKCGISRKRILQWFRWDNFLYDSTQGPHDKRPKCSCPIVYG